MTERPNLVAILYAPPAIRKAELRDKEVVLTPVALVGYSAVFGYSHVHNDTPWTKTWYSTSAHDAFWEGRSAHNYNKRSGACECNYPPCAQLGFVDIETTEALEDLDKRARLRLAWLAKRSARLEKARESAAERKLAKSFGEFEA